MTIDLSTWISIPASKVQALMKGTFNQPLTGGGRVVVNYDGPILTELEPGEFKGNPEHKRIKKLLEAV